MGHLDTKTEASDWVGMTLVGLVPLCVVGVFVYLGLRIGGVVGPEPVPPPAPAYHLGQMVKMRAFDTTGMVVDTWCRRKADTCTYSVRFSAMQMHTNVGLFGADGPVDFAPVALVRGIEEFELEAAH